MIKEVQKITMAIGTTTLSEFFECFDEQTECFEYEGETYRKKYRSQKRFRMIVGEVEVNRHIYQKDRGGKSIAPLDKKWGMENRYVSQELEELLLYSCAHNTPEETSKLYAKMSGQQIHPTNIKRLIKDTAVVMEEQKESMMASIYEAEELAKEVDVMVCSLDGVNVLLNEPGKKKGRPRERPENEAGSGNKSSYKNAMCGTVTHYQIIRKEEAIENKRIMTKYVSQMPEERYPTFKAAFEQEIAHCTQANPIKKLILTDGHKSIQGYIGNNPMFKDFDWMLDFYHAAEHLSKLAEALFGKSKIQSQDWYKQKRNELKHVENGARKVIRSAEYYLKKQKLSKTRKETVEKEIRFFKNHKNKMNYALHLKNGWPIGSGVVEAACKSVVKQRMCRSGQRWSREGGQNILNLRTMVKSDRWETFWPIFQKARLKKCA